MIDWRDPDGRRLRGYAARDLLRWSCAAGLIVAAHIAIVSLAMHWRSAAAALGAPPPAVMIDLSPLAVAPVAPPQDVAPGPQVTEAEPYSAPPPPEPEQKSAQESEQEKPQPVTEKPEIKLPEMPKPETAEVLLPSPSVEAEVKKKTSPKKKVERRKPREVRPAARQTSAPPSAQVRPADRAAAPTAGEVPSAAASASWKSELIAHLNRYKRFPSGASSNGGTATVAFIVNRSGQVVSSRLLRSSGDSVLDAEAISLPRRASPVPAPPGTGSASFGLAVPIRFSR